MRSKVLFISTIFSLQLFSGCSIVKDMQHKKLQETSSFKHIKKELEKYRADNNIYWGEGISIIGDDIGKSRDTARNEAFDHLAQQIEVRVISDFERLVFGETTITDRLRTDSVKERIRSKVKLYTDIVVHSVHEIGPFIDYPRKGDLTYFIYISKKDYEEFVVKDMEAKKSIIISDVKNGDIEYNKGNYWLALKHWLEAKNRNEDFFSDLINYDIDRDGTEEQISAYLDRNLFQFIKEVTLNKIDEEYYYDVDGRVNKNPMVYLKLKKSNGSMIPLQKFSLKVTFRSGSGEMNTSLITGEYGEATLSINSINPNNKVTIILIQMDDSQFVNPTGFSMPSTELTLKRKKTVLINITNKINEINKNDPTTTNWILSRFSHRAFGIKHIPAFNRDDIVRSNADFFISVIYINNCQCGVGGYSNLCVANCTTTIELYSLPDFNLISKSICDLKKGFGASEDFAIKDSHNKIQSDVENGINKLINEFLK